VSDPAPPDADGLSAEALRALGWRLDAQGWRGLRLDARGPVLALAGQPPGPRPPARLALPPAALAGLVAGAARQRGWREPYRATRPRPGTLGYQEALRLLGRWLDRREARLVRLIEHGDGLIVQHRAPAGGAVATILVPWTDLASWHRAAVRRRASAPRWPDAQGA